MEILTTTGDITPVGQIIHPVLAEAIGSTLLQHHHDFHHDTLESDGDAQSYSPYISRGLIAEKIGRYDLRFDEVTLWETAKEQFVTQLTDHDVDVDALNFTGDFFVGTPGEGRWHIDGRDYRLLVNLSILPLTLTVATSWRKATRAQDAYSPHPVTTQQFSYITGEGVYLDSNKQAALRQPHAGTYAHGKVFMRLRAFPRHGSHT